MDGAVQTAANRWWRQPHIYCLLLVVLLGHFLRLNTLTLRGEESRRFAIGWEMVQTGDWIVTKVQGEPVFYRPPLQNWLLGISARLCGTTEPWAIRLPGALAVLATTLLLYFYCLAFLSPLGAFAAGAAFATMAQVLELGRLAETESLFTLFVSGSLFAWHWGYVHGWPDRRMWMTAYFIAGLGMLTKGFQAPVYLGAATVLFLLWRREWRRLFTMAHAAGIAMFVLVYAAWFVPYVLEMGLAAGKRMFFFDSVDHVEGLAGVRHLLEFPLEVLSCMLPWSILLFGYASRTLRRSLAEARPMTAFLLTCIVATFPSCWLSAGGAPRYWMVMYPCVAGLIGVVVERFAQAAAESRLRPRWVAFLTLFGIVMAAAAVCAVGASWSARGSRFWQPWPYAMVYALAAGVLALLALGWRRRPQSLIPLLAIPCFVGLTYSIWIINHLDGKSYDIVAEVNRLKRLLPAEARLVSFGQVYHRFAYYYGAPIENVPWPEHPGDVPDEMACFCFDADYLVRGLPFSWEKIADVVCSRFVGSEAGTTVIVGRRLPASPGASANARVGLR